MIKYDLDTSHSSPNVAQVFTRCVAGSPAYEKPPTMAHQMFISLQWAQEST